MRPRGDRNLNKFMRTLKTLSSYKTKLTVDEHAHSKGVTTPNDSRESSSVMDLFARI